MGKINFKMDGTTALGLVGGVLVLAGQVVNGIVSQKKSDAKLNEAVEKAVAEKLHAE